MNTAKLYANTRYDTVPLYKLRVGTKVHMFSASKTRYTKSNEVSVVSKQGSQVVISDSDKSYNIRDAGCVILAESNK